MQNLTPGQITIIVAGVALLAFCGCCGGCYGCRGESPPAEVKPASEPPVISDQGQLNRELGPLVDKGGDSELDTIVGKVSASVEKLLLIEEGRKVAAQAGGTGWLNLRKVKVGDAGKLGRVTVAKVTDDFLIVIGLAIDTRNSKPVILSLQNVDTAGIVDGQELDLSSDGSVFYAYGTQDFTTANGGSRRILSLIRCPPR